MPVRSITPDKLVTEERRSYRAVVHDLGIANRRERGRWRNDRPENSYQSTRRPNRKMRGLKRAGSAQRLCMIQAIKGW